MHEWSQTIWNKTWYKTHAMKITWKRRSSVRLAAWVIPPRGCEWRFFMTMHSIRTLLFPSNDDDVEEIFAQPSHFRLKSKFWGWSLRNLWRRIETLVIGEEFGADIRWPSFGRKGFCHVMHMTFKVPRHLPCRIKMLVIWRSTDGGTQL